MVTIFPGATYKPMPGSDQRPRRRKGRGAGFHVAVYGGRSIYDINLATGNDAHLYVYYDGSLEQNVDLDLIAYAGVDGNASMLWVETAGGTNPATVETEPWTPEQSATLARIARWAHDTEGTPLALMPDSRPTSRGIGHHRLGIDPWRVSGGELWSTHPGKLCPGAAKIAQIPAIIAAAIGGNPPQEDDLTPEEHATLDNIAGALTHLSVMIDPKYGFAVRIAAVQAQLATIAKASQAPIDVNALAASLVPLLVPALVAAIPGADEAVVETALRNVLGSLDATP